MWSFLIKKEKTYYFFILFGFITFPSSKCHYYIFFIKYIILYIVQCILQMRYKQILYHLIVTQLTGGRTKSLSRFRDFLGIWKETHPQNDAGRIIQKTSFKTVQISKIEMPLSNHKYLNTVKNFQPYTIFLKAKFLWEFLIFNFLKRKSFIETKLCN